MSAEKLRKFYVLGHKQVEQKGTIQHNSLFETL